ncbi:hypothetical protein [Aeromonas rivipollensis]|uniref:hypothetical protein n=1 Tax=Aeromonas rivipollensis TaxID=948519 RepID=UPI001F3A757F|nr:hypothetical protein [Aeromonas rivipollensis]MCE9957645.1 hypothetical protein [Aeromonas rivipollensis]
MLHGDFFDLYDVAALLQIPSDLSGEVMVYLRALSHVETVAETRSCKREPGKHATNRIFIRVVAIHPEPVMKLPPARKADVLRSTLVRLSKAMPSPRGSR